MSLTMAGPCKRTRLQLAQCTPDGFALFPEQNLKSSKENFPAKLPSGFVYLQTPPHTPTPPPPNQQLEKDQQEAVDAQKTRSAARVSSIPEVEPSFMLQRFLEKVERGVCLNLEKLNEPKLYIKRKILIERMRRMCACYEYSYDTLHVAVNYVDIYLSNDNVYQKKSELELLASTAVYVAGKAMEDDQEPYLAQVMKAHPVKCHSLKHFNECERKLLQILDWDVTSVTPHLLAAEVMSILKLPDVPILLHKFDERLKPIVSDTHLFLPSIIAAATLIMLRRDPIMYNYFFPYTWGARIELAICSLLKANPEVVLQSMNRLFPLSELPCISNNSEEDNSRAKFRRLR